MKKRITALFITLVMIASFVPTFSVNAASIEGWNVSFTGGCAGSAEIDYNIGSDSQQSLKIVCESDAIGDVYILLTTTVPVVKGRSYIYGGDVKSDSSSMVKTMVDWGTRTDLLYYGSTFDFKKYQLKYLAKKTGKVKLMFLIEGKSDGVWFDNMFFMDEEEKVNLISNPDFEEKEEDDDEVEIGKNEYQQMYIDINNGQEYDVKDADTISSMYHNYPVFYKEITVDADASDWEGINMAYMPFNEAKQIQKYAHDDAREKDLKIDYAFAYDEEYLYMYYNVHDDLTETFDEVSEYWRGDSIQFILSHRGETSGDEYGIIHDGKTNKGMILSTAATDEMISQCKISTKREGNYTTYEAAIPWSLKYDERPEEILFDFIINDNDYAGRSYCVQLAPGIAESKENTEYPTFTMVEKGQDWFAWLDGEPVANLNEETIYNLFISNYGEDKTFTIKVNGEEKEVTVKGGRGHRESVPITFEKEQNDVLVKAEVVYEGKTYELSYLTNAKMKKPAPRTAKLYQDEMEAHAKEIGDLIEQCEAKGMSVEYEKVNWQTLNFFAGFMQEDIDNKDLDRINYTYNQLTDIYNEAKSNLEAYLAGEKTPLNVPKYDGGRYTINGTTTYADTFDGEKYENRPVFFIGYGHFYYAMNDIPKLAIVGSNSIQNEGGLRATVKSPGKLVDGSFTVHGNDAKIEIQTDVTHSGERAAKITNTTPSASDVYAYFNQNYQVKPNTNYVGYAWVKGKNVKEFSIATSGWNDRVYYDVTDEWQKLEFSFTSKSTQYLRSIRFIVSDIAEELYIDDISIKEEGSDVELFHNGGFETAAKEGEKYVCSEASVNEIRSMLERAEDYNVAADVLLSPHYMLNEFHTMYPEASTKGGGFISYDVNHPEAREIVELYTRFFVERIKDYESLNSICITNEPTFRSNRIPTYNAKWHKFLEERHGSIDVLNKLYKTNYTSFEEVEMPLVMGEDPACIDYQIFNDLEFSDWHRWMTDIVHEIAPGIPVHFKVMPYVNSYETGHARENMTHGYSLEYTADSFDVNGCDSHNFLTNKSGNKIQTMWYDFQVSIKDAPVYDTEHHIMPDTYDKVYSDEYDAYAVANIWQGAFHYRANSVVWAWDRVTDKGSTYWGLEAYRPKSVWGIGIATHDLNRLSYQVEAVQNEKTDIAILYSDASRMYDQTEMNLTYETYDALMCLGKKVKFVTEMQTEKMQNYKILIVPGIDYAREKTLDAVIDFINNGGQVVLLGENCFRYTEYMHDANAVKRQYILENSTIYPHITSAGEKLLGITNKEYKNLLRDYLKNQNQIWVEVVDAKTGEICEDIEYNVAVYDGKLIVNVCNYSEDVDINVLFSGEKAKEIFELRSMTSHGDTITAKKYLPILLEIELESPFIDTFGHWSESNVYEANTKNLVSGTGGSRFEPDRKVTRAEFVTMLSRASELRPEIYEGVFTDVNKDDWYAMYMQSAYNAGIIDGVNARPNDYITREEMCIMAMRAFERKHKAVPQKLSFVDINEISDVDSVSKAYGSGIIKGYDDNTFRPRNVLTRSEAVAVILSLYNKG